MEWKSGERRMSVGLPATGLSSSSASVWANPVPRSDLKKWPFVLSRIRWSQASAADQGIRPPFFAFFDERCKAVLAEIPARVEEDQEAPRTDGAATVRPICWSSA